jgi:Ca2+/H+ antiporter
VQKIAALAGPKNLTVFLLAVTENVDQEPDANLRLANLSALISVLSTALKAPVIGIPGHYTEMQPFQRFHLSEPKGWGVALIIIIALFGIMFSISQATSAWIKNILLLAAFLIAILMFWFWNKHR